MATLTNTAEGGTVDVAVTAGNSGGASGNAFDAIGTSGTSSAVYKSDVVADGTRSILWTVDSGGVRYAVWNDSWTDTQTVYFGFKFRVNDATPASNTQIVQIRETDGVTVGCDVRLSTTGQIQLRAPAVVRYTSSTTISANEWVRLELRVVSSSTVGRIQARLFVGANVDGVTPDEEFGSASTNWDTGDGLVGGIGFGICASAGQALNMYTDSVTFTDVDWPGPVNPPSPTLSESYIGIFAGGLTWTIPSLSPILIPDTGAWWGGVVAAADASTSSTEAGLTLYNSMSGIRPLQIIGVYKTGNWNGTFTSGELNMFSNAGGGQPAIPHVRWKPGTTGSPSNWATVASGSVDSVLDTAFAEMATWPGKIFFTFHHEPEDDAGPTNYTDADWVAAWIRCHDRAALAGATNLIWVPNFMGFYGHISHVVAMMSGIEGYFDWIAQDPYAAETASRDTLGELLNWDPFNNWGSTGPGYEGFYDWANTVYPGVPQMLAEFGVDGGSDSAHGVIDATDAITIINNWKSALASYPAVKAYQYWHADGIGDYQITDRGGVGVSAFVSFTNDSFFAQDPTLGYD